MAEPLIYPQAYAGCREPSRLDRRGRPPNESAAHGRAAGIEDHQNIKRFSIIIGATVDCDRGCDRREIISTLRRAGIWPDDGAVTNHAELATDRRRRDEKTRQYVASVWREARLITGTPAEQYLRNRGITGALPRSLRYHP